MIAFPGPIPHNWWQRYRLVRTNDANRKRFLNCRKVYFCIILCEFYIIYSFSSCYVQATPVARPATKRRCRGGCTGIGKEAINRTNRNVV